MTRGGVSAHPGEGGSGEEPGEGQHVPRGNGDEVLAAGHGDDGPEDAPPGLAVVELKHLHEEAEEGEAVSEELIGKEGIESYVDTTGVNQMECSSAAGASPGVLTFLGMELITFCRVMSSGRGFPMVS